jgi:transcriptional regulator with XRE-family HTH domain
MLRAAREKALACLTHWTKLLSRFGFRALAGPECLCYNAAMTTTAALPELAEIRKTFGLSKNELADLLHRRASSITEWEHRGIPLDRQASVDRLIELARVFSARVIASRIPEIVRTPDDWLGGRTMLQTLAQEGVDPIYSYLARLFSYNGS